MLFVCRRRSPVERSLPQRACGERKERALAVQSNRAGEASHSLTRRWDTQLTGGGGSEMAVSASVSRSVGAHDESSWPPGGHPLVVPLPGGRHTGVRHREPGVAVPRTGEAAGSTWSTMACAWRAAPTGLEALRSASRVAAPGKKGTAQREREGVKGKLPF